MSNSDIIYSSKGALIAFLEEYGFVTSAGSGAPTDAQYVTLATNSTLTAERVLTQGSGISIVDGGAGSTVTISATGGGISWDGSTANGVATYKNATEATVESNLTFDGAHLVVGGSGAKLTIEETAGTDYRVVIDPDNGPRIQFGDDSSDSAYMDIGAFSNINNIDTQDRDFHLYGSNTTTGFYFDESAGRFGILTGSTSNPPQHTLDINGDLGVTGNVSASANIECGGTLSVGDGANADGDTILTLNTDRAWAFKQSGNGSSAGLMLQNTVGPNKDFIIKTNGETRFFDNDGVERAVIDNDTGDMQLDGDLTVSSAGSTIAQETWIAPTLESNWSNYGGTYVEAGYMKDSMGFVHIRGMIDCDGSGDHMFTLPVGYRPASRLIFVVLYYDNGTYRPGRLDIYGASDATYPGEVHILYPSTVASADWVSIEGITFDTR